ncbi:MAG: methylmalonyl-CoA mutase family protein [Hyphomicrobium sp.]
MTTPKPNLDLARGFAAQTYDQWRGLVDKALKGADFDKRLVARTADGLPVKPLYARKDALVQSEGAMPGAAPFTRGTSAVREGQGWNIASMHIEQDPKSANTAILEDLAGGVNVIVLQIGGPGAAVGLPATKDALEAALKDVLLDVCPIALVAGEQSFDAAAALQAVWTARDIPLEKRCGSFGADPLGTLARQGRLSDTLETAMARAVALTKLALPMPRVAALAADGVCYHTAGASEAQELAIMLATLVAYLRACEKGGIAPADALPKISVALAADADQFATIAKLRAARKLVWRVADACGAGDTAARVRFACPTSYRMMTRRDPWTNILRTTIACAGAALGGADSICVLPFTFALGKPDAFARRVARNIQIVCQEESNLGRVTDPAGGSWYVEQLTDDMAKKAWDIFQDIEARGGMLVGLTTGYVQEMIAKTADARAKAIATGRTEITGVSAFPILGDDGIKAEPWPKPAALPSGKAELDVTPLQPHRLGEDFEALRDAADAAGGFTVFLASMGEIADHNVRTTWVKNYLAAGGIDALVSDGFQSAAVAAAAFNNCGTTVACICSSNAVNATHAEITARALKAKGATWVMMAGRPGTKDGDREAALRAAGVDQFLFAGADAVATLKGLQERLG